MILLYLDLIDSKEDQDKLEQIYLTYKSPMYNVANSILKNEADAEDVVHTVFFKIIEKHLSFLLSLDSEKRIKYYLLAATRNTALNHIHKPQNTHLPFNDSELTYSIPFLSDDSFFEAIDNKLTYEDVVNAIALLDTTYRDTLRFHFLHELSVAETAAQLNQTISATKKQIVRGKKLLLAKLKRTGE